MSRKRIHSDVVESEEALIGSLVIDPDQFDRIGGVKGSELFDEDLAKLLDVMRENHEAGKANDIVLLRDQIKARGINLTTAQLAKMFTSVPSATHARYYAESVREASRIRRIESLSNTVAQMTTDVSRDSVAILEYLQSELEDIQKITKAKSVSMHEAGVALLDEISSRKKSKRSATTGLATLDSQIGGLMPGEVFIIAARPGVGKTSLAIQIALHNATHNRPAVVFSLEMRKEELAGRVFGGLADVDSRDIRSGNLSEHQMHMLVTAIDNSAEYPLHVFDPPSMTMLEIRSAVKSFDRLSLVVIDYLSLITPSNRKEPRHEQVSDISRQIKKLAKEAKVPIIALQQLNRDADGNKPKLSHLRESGSIEQDADAVMFIHQNSRTDIELIIAKNRHGETGTLPMVFDPQHTTFGEPEFQSFGEVMQ